MINTDIQVKLEHRYNFPQLSTYDVEVIETRECYVEFYEDEFLWVVDWSGVWKDWEDPETKVVSDKEQACYWRVVNRRCDIISVQVDYDMGIQLWLCVVVVRGRHMRLAFKTKEKAHRMYTYFCQYAGYAHY